MHLLNAAGCKIATLVFQSVFASRQMLCRLPGCSIIQLRVVK
jgi:hypothetical protein